MFGFFKGHHIYQDAMCLFHSLISLCGHYVGRLIKEGKGKILRLN
jgi:hypothetical protein